MNVDTAYLNAKIIDDKPVFLKIGPIITAIIAQLDSSFEKHQDEKGSAIVKVDKTLYGDVESAVLPYKNLREILGADEY